MMDFDIWWRVTGQLDEGGKDDWRECWDAAVAAERERCAQVADEHAKRTFAYSSENAHIYHAQADWAEAIAKSIRQLKA